MDHNALFVFHGDLKHPDSNPFLFEATLKLQIASLATSAHHISHSSLSTAPTTTTTTSSSSSSSSSSINSLAVSPLSTRMPALSAQETAALSAFTARDSSGGLGALSMPVLLQALTHKSYRDQMGDIFHDRYRIIGKCVFFFNDTLSWKW